MPRSNAAGVVPRDPVEFVGDERALIHGVGQELLCLSGAQIEQPYDLKRRCPKSGVTRRVCREGRREVSLGPGGGGVRRRQVAVAGWYQVRC